MALKLICFHCGKEMEFVERVGLRDECPGCRSDAHVCKNCEFYDVKVYNECRETQAEVVREKERFNRCDYFRPRGGGGPGAVQDKTAALRAAAEALFKKS
ncbi:MAG: hypothetical protein KF802_00680 [Bdellovibrionaceae bacterium]|nr:hypothetical protein [Pseudobdellovibrionaceae bacterium]MBX3034990.1 hypothetical protein [Pseudobdellovibrionaceae bacterium]